MRFLPTVYTRKKKIGGEFLVDVLSLPNRFLSGEDINETIDYSAIYHFQNIMQERKFAEKIIAGNFNRIFTCRYRNDNY